MRRWHRRQYIPVVLVLLLLVSPADSDRLRQTAVVGQTAVLRCHTMSQEKVSWSYRKTPDERKSNVVRYGITLDGFQRQFALQITPAGEHNLFIRDVDVSNSGVYTCTEDGGLGPDITSYSFIVEEADIPSSTTTTTGRPTSRSTVDVITPARSATECHPQERSEWIPAVTLVGVAILIILVSVVIVFEIRNRRSVHKSAPQNPQVPEEQSLRPNGNHHTHDDVELATGKR